MRRKSVLAAALLSLFVLVLGGCAGGDGGPAIHVQVDIVKDGQTLLSTQAEVTGDAPRADDAVIAACKQEKLAYTYTAGMFDSFGGEASTKTDGWLLYHNDELAEVGAKDIAVAEGDSVAFKYENYDAVFAQ